MELKHCKPENVEQYRLLLIVPYGIETSFKLLNYLGYGTFNRTLWN